MKNLIPAAMPPSHKSLLDFKLALQAWGKFLKHEAMEDFYLQTVTGWKT